MPNWLYAYFRDTIEPMIKKKDGRNLVQPPAFTDAKSHAPSSFWIYPPEPTLVLRRQKFDPTILYLPRVFLWLPHFFVKTLNCPKCRKPLEKNGALRPRRITDVDDTFYIVSWAYYCRQSCRAYFHGWSKPLLESLPAYLRLAFPATLSRMTGLSRNVMSLLRVGNQHKMGPSGVRALLYETHTLRFNVRLNQYGEAIFELVQGHQLPESDGAQSSLHSYIQETYLPYGNFGDPQRNAGHVPSEHYLAEMMNKAIEEEEAEANQHTACLALDQISIDDSHKVRTLQEFDTPAIKNSHR